MQELVGEYNLYQPLGSEFEDDPNYVREEDMQKLVLQNFKQMGETLLEALKCEDYQEIGILDLAQMVEAISTVKEDLDPSVLNYMLYYVLVRSQDHDNMEYQHLIQLLDALKNSSESRVQSAVQNNRPESSGPEQLKVRNPSAAEQAKASDNEDNYSEDIAEDPDEEGANEAKDAAQNNAHAQEKDDEDNEYANDEEFEDSPR